MGEYLINWAKEHNMDAEMQNDMAVINPKGEALLMLGHMDTISGELPVELDEEKGVITGRGAADAKGPLCAAIAALEKHPELWNRVCIVGAPDEEGWSQAAKAIRDNWSERPVIILEPSTWQGITLSYMGRLAVKIKVSCEPSHPGHLKPYAVEELFECYSELVKDRIVRIRHLHGKDIKGIMSLDIRYRDETPEEILSKISKRFEYDVLEKAIPYTANKNTKLTRSFLHAVRDLGGTPVFKKKTGTSDMNVLGEKWTEAPILAYGPGDGRLGHTDHEKISIEEYLNGIEVLSKALGYIFS
jgi:LysW-gamma-L-lysine carboxypeptidase